MSDPHAAPREASAGHDQAVSSDQGEAPYPGTKLMPRWNVGELIPPPTFLWRNLPMFLGPGLVAGAAAIGGGEWLTGPLVSARYGGALLWLCTLSILFQVVYNIEISRYTLYTGEPIFTGKFRIPPGPIFWAMVYLAMDFGSILPYLASSAAVPLFAMLWGRLPDSAAPADVGWLGIADITWLRTLGCFVFLGTLFPLLVGGKVFTSLKAIMSFKLVVVVGFLGFLAIGYSTFDTWVEIVTGFFQFGNVPVGTAKDPAIDNVFLSLAEGRGFPVIDMSMVGIIAAMAAITGNGGLTNTPISSYTRDQGWGMGKQVGAIPSFVGGRDLALSHVGMVFRLTPESLQRWAGWLWHVQREQLFLWMPACFLGIALPSMLSVQFLTSKNVPDDKWLAAGMTADGVSGAVGPTLGPFFWYVTLFCGLLVLSTSMATTADGFLRRWVDMIWTASPHMRRWDPRNIGTLYFSVLCAYAALGVFLLIFIKGDDLVIYSTMLYNYVLGLSCWHVFAVNTLLLPRQLRPGILRLSGLFLGGVFFTAIAVLATVDQVNKLRAPKKPPAPPAPVVAPAEPSATPEAEGEN